MCSPWEREREHFIKALCFVTCNNVKLANKNVSLLLGRRKRFLDFDDFECKFLTYILNIPNIGKFRKWNSRNYFRYNKRTLIIIWRFIDICLLLKGSDLWQVESKVDRTYAGRKIFKLRSDMLELHLKCVVMNGNYVSLRLDNCSVPWDQCCYSLISSYIKREKKRKIHRQGKWCME